MPFALSFLSILPLTPLYKNVLQSTCFIIGLYDFDRLIVRVQRTESRFPSNKNYVLYTHTHICLYVPYALNTFLGRVLLIIHDMSQSDNSCPFINDPFTNRSCWKCVYMYCGRRNNFISKPTSLKYYRSIVYAQYTFNSIECLGKLHSTDLGCDYILLSSDRLRTTLHVLPSRGGYDSVRRRKPSDALTVFVRSGKGLLIVFLFSDQLSTVQMTES